MSLVTLTIAMETFEYLSICAWLIPVTRAWLNDTSSQQVTSAWRKGRVDAVVQSTDKNFMVPVGGAVVAASKQDPSLVAAVNKVMTFATHHTPDPFLSVRARTFGNGLSRHDPGSQAVLQVS